jgi:dTDP-4-amino-4,6-dideoxygalactose transaminase
MNIPFVDLKAQYASIKSEIDDAVHGVISSTQFIGGQRLQEFESAFARYSEAEFAVGTSSGTSALHLALVALGIGDGDEVITASNTFIATTEAITHAGAKPVLVDVVDDTLNIDPEAVESAITGRTRAIIPVHLYGQSADMDAIRDIARRHSLKIVSDAAQCHGGRLNGSKKAILGDVSCFSFYPGKNLGAYGDGGMVITDDKELADRIRMLSNHGRHEKYTHLVEGFNYRLDAIQAAVLNVKLKHLDDWTENRRRAAKHYGDSFAASERVRPVQERSGYHHVYHLYVIRTPRRDELLEGLRERGIGVGIHYPIPLHLQDAYSYLSLPKGSWNSPMK